MIGTTSSKRMILAAEVISNNVDLLTEILVRVPAKSLLRFRCVSKHWFSLISDTHFACNHARVNQWPSVYGFYYDNYSYESHDEKKTVSLHGHTTLPTLAFLKPRTVNPSLLHSCNGLILLCKGFRSPVDCYIVCNPTTQKYTLLPKAPVLNVTPYGALLAFDPSKSPHYKVLIIEYHKSLFSIFSSESSSWIQVNIILPQLTKKRLDYFFGGIFWSGSMHWLSNEFFIRFDFEAKKLISMRHPCRPKILPVDKIRYFGECCGHLFLIQSRLLGDLASRILEMERDYSGWIVKYRVNLRHLTSAFPMITSIKYDYKFNFLSVMKGKTEKHFTLVLAIGGTVISYDLECKTWTVLDFARRFPIYHSDSDCFRNSYQFIESLAPI